MTKTRIINIDLGMKIEDIISQDIAEISGQARVALTEAIDTQRKLTSIREAREAERKAANDAINEVLEKAYMAMFDSTDGVSAAQLLEIVQPHIAVMSALTLRMKTMLRDNKGNEYIMRRKGSGQRAKYFLEAFNAQTLPEPSTPEPDHMANNN